MAAKVARWALLSTVALVLLASSCQVAAFPADTEVALSPSTSSISEDSRPPNKPTHRGKVAAAPRSRLSGRFLHLTDLHPDPHYKPGSSASTGCHVDKPKKDKWRAGHWGTPVSGCDSPVHLVEESMKWISENWMPKKHSDDNEDGQNGFDFIIWTGDSARHDIDNIYPRTRQEIYDLNRWCLDLIQSSFPGVPIVPNIGNNDIFPHNIMWPGPNDVTSAYSEIWADQVPEYERHTFQLGGYFSTEVIPNKLAVISLNTLYFYDSNKVVDGCKRINRERKQARKDRKGASWMTTPAAEAEDDTAGLASYTAEDISSALLKAKDPGTIQLLWLEAQLYQFRQRGLAVHIIGHVPPTSGNYFPRCYDAYSDIILHYQEIVIGQHFGHMNIDAFFVQEDTEAVKREEKNNRKQKGRNSEASTDDTPGSLTATANDDGDIVSLGLSDDLRKDYALLSGDARTNDSYYHFFFASPGIVPTFLPSARMWTYNVSGLDLSDWDGENLTPDHEKPLDLLSGDEDEDSDEEPSTSPLASLYHFSNPQVSFQSAQSPSTALKKQPWRNATLVATHERFEALQRKHRRPRHGGKHKHKKSPLPRHSSPDSPVRTNTALSLLGYSHWTLDLDATNEEWNKKKEKSAQQSSHGNFSLDFHLEYATYTPENLWKEVISSELGLSHDRGSAVSRSSAASSPPPVPRHLLLRELHRHNVKPSDFLSVSGSQSETEAGASPLRHKLHLPKALKSLTDWQLESITVSSMLRLARRLAVDDKLWKRYRARLYESSGYED